MRPGLLAAAAVLAPAIGAVAASATDVRLVGLTDANALVRFTSGRPGEVARVTVSGVGGTLLGIDVRPADGRLYGISSTNDLYTVEAASGAARLVSTLTSPFDGGPRSGVDFNPQSDRLRLLAASGQNLRVHVDLGAVATDGALGYAPGDVHHGTKARITAVAYTNSVASAPNTKTFDIDGELDVLALQDPPNDGILTTVGPLGVDFGPRGGFDIVTDGSGADAAFAASGAALYTIDLGTGRATHVGTIGDGSLALIGLAAEPLVGP